MLYKRQLLQLALVVSVGACALAQQGPQREQAPSVERLREHVTYLASDKLEGRRTGTEGAKAAAEYIAREFSRYGLRRSNGVDLPGMSILEADSPTRYFQGFPFVAGVTLGQNNAMRYTALAPPKQGEAGGSQSTTGAAALDLRLNEDWTPLGFSSNAAVTDAPATFVGFGIKAAELKYDDYAGADLKGRVAVAFAGTPDGDNPHGPFARYTDTHWKAIAAREQGAVALLLISGAENFRDDRLARLSYDNTGGDVGLPVVIISRQAAARILAASGLAPLAELEKSLRATSQTNAGAGALSRQRQSVGQQLGPVALSLRTDIVRRNTPGTNVIGILGGSDPQLKNETIIIGAHYDHLGRGGEGSLAPREGEVHHGADDNASGVAGLLELARLFSAQEMRPRRTLVFIAFSGEEAGLIGSDYYVNHPVVPLAQTIAMLNMDMIGRMKENRLLIGGVGTAAEWKDWINSKNMTAGVKPAAGTKSSAFVAQPFILTLNEDGYGPSDHSSFYSKQVPVLFFFTGTHEDYHKPSDTADKINYADEARVVSLVRSIIQAVDENPKRPAYLLAKSEGTRRPMSFSVTLGVVPNYAEATDGMKIDGVRDGGPAALAGLQAGDKITRLAGHMVRNVQDYTYALGEMKAGQEYEIEVVRGSQTLKLKVTPTARK